MENREHEAQIACNRRLECKERLDRALDIEEQAVDLVVEGDHLVGELRVALLQRPHGSTNHGQDPLALLLEMGLDPVESFVDRHADTVYRRSRGRPGAGTTS